MAHAIVAIEDKRFYTEPGIDIRGIARAFVADIFGGSGTQGASTITEQFVKNALGAAVPPHGAREVPRGGDRLPARAPLEEAADPRRLPQHRVLRQRRLRHRGGGARVLRQRPAVEPLRMRAAAECQGSGEPVRDQPDRRRGGAARGGGRAPTELQLPAGRGLRARRGATSCCKEMASRATSTAGRVPDAQARRCRRPSTSRHPRRRPPIRARATSSAGSPTSCAAPRTPPENGRLHRRLHDPHDARHGLQSAGAEAVNQSCRQIGAPSAALVAIDNSTGEVRAMVGGYNYNSNPFNLATEAERQPGLGVEGLRPRHRARERLHAPTRTVSRRPGPNPAPGRHLRHVHRPQRRGRLLQRQDPAVAGARGLRQQRLRARRARAASAARYGSPRWRTAASGSRRRSRSTRRW